MNWQRHSIGLAGTLILASGLLMLISQSAHTEAIQGILIRVGLVLGAIWLAYPQLEPMRSKSSSSLWLIVLIGLVLIAARPKIFRIVAIVVAAGLLVSWTIQWLKRVIR